MPLVGIVSTMPIAMRGPTRGAHRPDAPDCRPRPPLFRNFAARYRESLKNRWKPSSPKTHHIYMKGRITPAFGPLPLDRVNQARVSACFDAASVDRPRAANRAFEILCTTLRSAHQWGELPEDAPDPGAHIVMNPRRPVPRYLAREELERLGTVLDVHFVRGARHQVRDGRRGGDVVALAPSRPRPEKTA